MGSNVKCASLREEEVVVVAEEAEGKERDKEDDNAKGESPKRGSVHFETKASVNVHPDIWSALKEDAKSQLAAARREVIRNAKAARTERDRPKDNKDSSSPYLMSNRPRMVNAQLQAS